MPQHSLRAGCKRWILILILGWVPGTTLAQESPVAAIKTTLVQPTTIQPEATQPSTIQPETPSPLVPTSYVQPAYVQTSYVQRTERGDQQHRFWDRDNRILFVGVGAAATADFFVTRSNLAHGGRELNPVTRVFAGSTTGLAFNFVGETAGSIGVSYLFHKTGHHKLERITSFVSIGSSASAVGFGLAHR